MIRNFLSGLFPNPKNLKIRNRLQSQVKNPQENYRKERRKKLLNHKLSHLCHRQDKNIKESNKDKNSFLTTT